MAKQLGWSLSRARMFEECPRRYYYHYYYSRVGYAPDAPEDAVLALEMKRIKGLDMWVGEVVHQTIEWILVRAHGGISTSKEEVLAETKRNLSEGWKASRSELWRRQNGDRCPNLFEHYYKVEVGKAVTDRLKDKALTCVTNFVDGDVTKEILASPPEDWLPVEKFAAFDLDGILMYVKFDFALKNGEGLTVYDWKTGKPTKDEVTQLACYAMYNSGKYTIPLERIRVCAVHLQPKIEVYERMVESSDVEEARRYIKDGFNGMLKCLRHPARNIAVMEDFPTSGNYLRCMRCCYKGICEQGMISEVSEPPPEEVWEEYA